MKVPILRLPFLEEDIAFISAGTAEVLRSGMLSLGKYTRQFEEMFRALTGARHALACNSGTAALELILRGLGIEGKSVIVPTNTFLATALAAMHTGNRVIFADSDPATLALDVADVARRLREDTAAVILVHIGGIITPAVHKLRQLCQERHLYLIEDCAHAHGSSLDGLQAGTLGVAGAFSFYPTKVLTTGEGGMVTTNDEALARRMEMLRNQGKNPTLSNRISEYGHNFRMSELTAVVGVAQMKRASAIIAERRRAAAFYDHRLKDVQGLRPLDLPPEVHSTYYKYIAYLEKGVDRAKVKAALRERSGVALTGEVYADLCHTEPLWERFTYCGRQRAQAEATCHLWPACGCDQPQSGFPGAEYISQHHICLPVYPGLTQEELEYVVTSLRQVIAESVRS